MKCILFNDIESKQDDTNPFSYYFETDLGNYYLEPLFLTKFNNYNSVHNNQSREIIIECLKKQLKKDSVLVLCDDIEEAITKKDKARFLEFRDIIDLCQLPINDNSRGSDYGD
ncbi:MAG: hypothetical protein LBM99_04245 [Bacillales bacterium]|jgi:sensor histidine kinase YesM|nr:hypothetical protein [Bacillales bacterium]